MPPPWPEPIPPPEPVPFEGVVYLESESPKFRQPGQSGNLASGGAMMVGSIASLGFKLLYTATAGVNWRSALGGNLPRLAGRAERSPPPPPPMSFLGCILA